MSDKNLNAIALAHRAKGIPKQISPERRAWLREHGARAMAALNAKRRAAKLAQGLAAGKER